MDLVCSDPAHLVTSFTNGQIGLFNMETRQLVLTLESTLEPGEPHRHFHQTFSVQPILNVIRCCHGNERYNGYSFGQNVLPNHFDLTFMGV